jgi:hypothetical protein
MRYVIAGFGNFGRKALERLLEYRHADCIAIVERDPRKKTNIPAEVEWIPGDAIHAIVSSRWEPEDVVIPMVPFNLAAKYLLSRHIGMSETELPPNLEYKLPNPVRIDDSNVICSKANFLCPDDCPEGDLCTVTGLRRTPLHEELRLISIPDFTVLVLTSRQILPGIGGYSVANLNDISDGIMRGKYILATSCKCHAILTGLIPLSP